MESYRNGQNRSALKVYIRDGQTAAIKHSVDSKDRSNMMKFAVATLAVLALSTPLEALTLPRTGNGALADELQGFVNIIPVDDIVAIFMEYLGNDSEVQKLATYIHSNDFMNLINDVEAIPEVRTLLNYVQGAGLDVYKIVNKVHDLLGMKHLAPPAQVFKAGDGIRGLIDDVKAIFPREEIKALYRQKMATSKVFQDLMAQLSSPTLQTAVNKVCANPNFHSLLVKAKAAKVNVEAVKHLLERVLGITVPCKV